MTQSNKKKVFLISTKYLDSLFNEYSANKILFNKGNCVDGILIKNEYVKQSNELTLYDFYLNFLYRNYSYFSDYKDYKKGGHFKEEEIINELFLKYKEENEEITEAISSKFFNKIFQLKIENSKYNIFLTRCFPHKFINFLETKGMQSGILTNKYWLVCYINTVLSILEESDFNNCEFYGLLHRSDVPENFKNSFDVKNFSINNYNSQNYCFKSLFTYSHERGKDVIYDSIISNSTIFDGFDGKIDACDYLLLKLYRLNGISERIESLIKLGIKPKDLKAEDYMFIFDCFQNSIQSEKDKYKHSFGKEIEENF